MFSEVRKRAKKSGQPPGSFIYTGEPTNVVPVLTVITYSANSFHEATAHAFEEKLFSATDNEVTWVNVEGLHDVDLVKQIGAKFNLHPLTIEDILNVEQRPKVEEFDHYIFITLKVLYWHVDKKAFSIKQLSLVLGKNFVLSFQELDTTLFDSIVARLRNNQQQTSRMQTSDYLAYRLIDAVVDGYFIVLDGVGDQIEIAEEAIIMAPLQKNARTIYQLKREMLILRKAIWPMRDALSHLMHADTDLISPATSVYVRDIYDHMVQAIDTLEAFREMLSGMLDMYLSNITIRTNEIMKTLTIITTIFIPITSIASIYGMNFRYMPGLDWHYGYPAVLVIMGVIAVLMLIYFRVKKWI